MPSTYDSAPILDHTHGTGRVRVYSPRAGFYVSRIEGHFDGELCDAFLRPFEASPKTQRLVSFHDWREMTGYDTLLPARLVAFTLGYLSRTDRLVVSTRSTLVSMAVRAANLTLKRVELMPPEQFDAALETALRG